MKVPISFELFPPNTTEGVQKLAQTAQSLNALNPEYFSVTFGAGGHNRKKTFRVVRLLLKQNIPVAPHLTCIGLLKENIAQILKNYVQCGIRKIVAIRGDLPQEEAQYQGDFRHANELVAFIRRETGDHFSIEVAAYPEFHPQSTDMFTALKNFKCKVEAGANRAITQYFFNQDAYFQFLESCHQLDIQVPVIPGIMPVTSFEKLIRFSKACGTEIPAWLYKRLEAYRHDEASIKAYGVDVVTKLCRDLIAGGAPALHFYTLNQLEPTQTIVKNLTVA